MAYDMPTMTYQPLSFRADGTPRLGRSLSEYFSDDLTAMVIAANTFMKAKRSLEQDAHWESVLNGIGAEDFENGHVIQEVNRWIEKFITEKSNSEGE